MFWVSFLYCVYVVASFIIFGFSLFAIGRMNFSKEIYIFNWILQMYDRTSRTQAFTPSSRSSDEKKSNEYFNDKEKVRLNIKRRKTRH